MYILRYITVDDDKWYSSDEDDDVKPNISNILTSLNQVLLKVICKFLISNIQSIQLK